MVDSPAQFTLKTPMFLFGLLMFFVNYVSDTQLNLPFADLFLPVLTLWFVYKQNQIHSLIKAPAVGVTGLLMVLMTVSNLYNEVPFMPQVRHGIAVITLFLPIFFFITLKDREGMMNYIIGGIVGSALFFSYMTMTLLAGANVATLLRGSQLTPVVPLALYVLLRDKMSKGLMLVLLGATGMSIFLTFLINTRGPMVALVMALGLYGGLRFLPWPRVFVVLFFTGAILAHFLSSFFVTSSFDVVANSAKDTVSNLERAYAIDYSRTVLSDKPWFGGSPQGYAIDFTDAFRYVAGFAEEDVQIASPHNTFLEYAVFFGYPVGFLFVFLLARLMYVGIQTNAVARSFFVALVVSGIIRLAAFYGLSGGWRVEWFALMFALYYAFESPKPAVIPPFNRVAKRSKTTRATPIS